MTRRACVLLLAAVLLPLAAAWEHTFYYNATWVCRPLPPSAHTHTRPHVFGSPPALQNGTETASASASAQFLCAQCYNRRTVPEPTALCVVFAKTHLFPHTPTTTHNSHQRIGTRRCTP